MGEECLVMALIVSGITLMRQISCEIKWAKWWEMSRCETVWITAQLTVCGILIN